MSSDSRNNIKESLAVIRRMRSRLQPDTSYMTRVNLRVLVKETSKALDVAISSLEEKVYGPFVCAAKSLAEKAHLSQVWGEHPYMEHLERVVERVDRHFPGEHLVGPLDVLRAAAFLHDTVEDTALPLVEIEDALGPAVSDLVWRLTDEPGKNRKERKEATYPKIRASTAATYLKLCDRIVNVEFSLTSDYARRFFDMYQKEQEGFEKALRVAWELDPVWAELNSMLREKKD